MRQGIQHILSLPATDRIKVVVLGLFLALFGAVTITDGDLLAGTAQTALVETAETAAVTHATETVDNPDERPSALPAEWVHPTKLPVLPPELIDTETLWLARGLYSETKRPEEQELVAWSIRNRVETRYRGEGTYRGVILDPYQFSAFNPGNRKRQYFTSLTPHSDAPGWQRTLAIAKFVKEAPAELRPFSQTTRHYFSERSMVGRRVPHWAVGQSPVTPERDFELEAKRFRFYENIA